jgi:hypothetical protein
MPIEIRIDGEGSVVHTRLHGEVGRDEYLGHGMALLARTDLPKPLRELFDTREVTGTPISSEEIMQLTLDPAIGQAFAAYQPVRIAVLTAGDLDFGLGRMFAAIAEQIGFRVAVFRDDEAAARAFLDV